MIISNIFKIILNVLSILLYSIVLCILYFVTKLNSSYIIVILIPLVALVIILAIDTLINLFLNISILLFGRNDNIEFIEKVEMKKEKLNEVKNRGLLLVLLSLLFITMILDILLCLKNNKIFLLAISIVIWILLISIVIKCILKKKKMNF